MSGKFLIMRRLLLTLGAVTMAFAPLTPINAQAVGGAKSKIDTVEANGTDTYRIRFRAGHEARVAATADGEDIDLLIYDSNGNLAAEDTLDDDTPVCTWTPRWTGTFIVKVRKCESYRVKYAIVTN